MSLEDATRLVRDRVGEDVGIARTIKVDLGDDGVIHLDGRARPNAVTNEDKAADVTIRCSLQTLQDLLAGKANAQLAFIMGKLKVEGDMALAVDFAKALR